MVSTGNDRCPCIDASEDLAAATDKSCTQPDGQDGVRIPSGACVPYSFGSNTCIQHDLQQDPLCVQDLSTTIVPSYCFSAWCYVNVSICKWKSNEEVYRTKAFNDLDLFFSYSTCDSHIGDWLGEAYKQNNVLAGMSITAAIPTYYGPYLFKRNLDGDRLLTVGDEYWDDSIPPDGVYINYLREVVGISDESFDGITYTHTSNRSLQEYPQSSFTAAIQDIENGLVDMAVGPFWITRERLKKVSFTVPLDYSRTLLMIPKPVEDKSLPYQMSKVLGPFSSGVWALVFGIVIVSSLLSVWFNYREKMASMSGSSRSLSETGRPPLIVRARLVLDSLLENGMMFCSAGIGINRGDNLPTGLLMSGFGCFILIAVSAYVANLAAFLTKPGLDTYIGTIDEVISHEKRICAHPASKDDLELKWPSARFEFDDSGNEWHGVLDLYEKGDCEFLAVDMKEAMSDLTFRRRVCGLGLVFTDSLIVEIPLALPVRHEIASQLSYWVYGAAKYHSVSVENSLNDYIKNLGKPNCTTQLSKLADEGDIFQPILVENVALPALIFVGLSVIAITLHIFRFEWRKNHKKSLAPALVGRSSVLLKQSTALDLENSSDSVNTDHPSRQSIIKESRRSSFSTLGSERSMGLAVGKSDRLSGQFTSKDSERSLGTFASEQSLGVGKSGRLLRQSILKESERSLSIGSERSLGSAAVRNSDRLLGQTILKDPERSFTVGSQRSLGSAVARKSDRVLGQSMLTDSGQNSKLYYTDDNHTSIAAHTIPLDSDAPLQNEDPVEEAKEYNENDEELARKVRFADETHDRMVSDCGSQPGDMSTFPSNGLVRGNVGLVERGSDSHEEVVGWTGGPVEHGPDSYEGFVSWTGLPENSKAI